MSESDRIRIWDLMLLQALVAMLCIWFRFIVPPLQDLLDKYQGCLYDWPPWAWVRSFFGY